MFSRAAATEKQLDTEREMCLTFMGFRIDYITQQRFAKFFLGCTNCSTKHVENKSPLGLNGKVWSLDQLTLPQFKFK